MKSDLFALDTLNKGFEFVESEITIMFPLFVPVIATSPEAETFSARFVALPVNNIEDAVSCVLSEPAAFNAYEAVSDCIE